MSIVRVKKDARYFSASNEPFNDKCLSWETRGLMGFLLSKPNNWQIRMEALEKAGPAGNYKLRRMLAEARKVIEAGRIAHANRLTQDDGLYERMIAIDEEDVWLDGRDLDEWFDSIAAAVLAKNER